jgi:hypothetical protein
MEPKSLTGGGLKPVEPVPSALLIRAGNPGKRGLIEWLLR